MSSASQELYFDYDFVERLSEDFLCPVTLEVLREPYLTVCCGNHLSQEAADKLQGNQKPCPLCKQPLQAVPDKFFRRKVKELQVRCPKKGAGCGWVGQFGNLDQHLKNGDVTGDCQYVEVACPNLCDGRVLRRDLEGHKANDCPKRQFACEYCAYEATYQEISEDHWPQCSKYPMECPNDCGEGTIERQELPNHLEVCPLQIIDCEFDYAGCTDKVQRQEMQSHVKSSAHLQMVARHAKLQRKRIEQQEKRIEQQEKRIEQQEKRMEQQEKEIETLIDQVHQLSSTLQEKQTEQVQKEQQETQIETLAAQVHQLAAMLQVFTPPPVFTMTNFKQHKKDDDQWFSPPFYSHIGGYKMCISVKANGSDIGKGTHVAVYLHMMAGEYDDNLKWPFRGEVAVQLLNQKGNENHHEKALVEAADYSFQHFIECVARVEETQERGLAWGHDTFITHGGLAYNAGKDCQYLKNDCLKFQVNKVVVFDKL